MLLREQPIVGHDTEARTVTVRLCRWNDPRQVIDPDGASYREQFPPGSLELAGDVHVADRHLGALVGRADPDTFTDDGDGPAVTVTVARTAAGNDLMELVDAGIIRAVSMELEPVTQTNKAGVITRTKSVVHGLAFAFRPAHDAPILAVREQPQGVTAMPITDTPTLDAHETDAGPVVGELITGEILSRELDALRRDLIAVERGDSGHPLARFRSLGEAVEAGYSDTAVRDTLHRVIADQITGNNPGVIPPAWTSTIFGIIDRGRPTINAFGVESPGPDGMEVNWPYYDGNLYSLIGVQATQKTAITSARVDLKKGSEDLITYAGMSDLSYQLIRRSSPSYRDAYMRIMFAAYAAVTDNAAADGVSGVPLDYDVTADTDGSALRSAIFAASVQVEAATGSPAEFALAATDVFVLIGGMSTIGTAPYGVQNVAGTSDASSLSVNVNGIRIIHEPNFTNGKVIVSNSQAASWYEDGPFTVVAEDVEKLGQNVAVWGLGAFGVHLPSGIISLENVALAARSTRSTSDKK